MVIVQHTIKQFIASISNEFGSRWLVCERRPARKQSQIERSIRWRLSEVAKHYQTSEQAMGRWVMGQWVEWVTFLNGSHRSCPLTRDPCRYFAYTVKLVCRYQKSKIANEIRAYEQKLHYFIHLSDGAGTTYLIMHAEYWSLPPRQQSMKGTLLFSKQDISLRKSATCCSQKRCKLF